MPSEQGVPIHPSPDVVLAVRRNASGLCAIAECPSGSTVEASYIEATIELNGKPVRYRARLCERHYRLVAPAEEFMRLTTQLKREFDAP